MIGSCGEGLKLVADAQQAGQFGPIASAKVAALLLCDGMDFPASQDCVSQIERMKKSVALHK